jgi:UDP-glucose 4-epimerase
LIKKISISGSSGFLGSLLIKELKKNRFKLEIIKTKSITKKKNIGKDSSHFIHLGFDTRKEKCNINNQVKIIKKIIENSKKFNFKILFFSTTCGGSKNKRKLYKYNRYQIAKYLCEKELISNKKLNVDFAIFRVFNLYGPNPNNRNIISEIKEKILTSKNSEVQITNPKSTRDFIFVKDLINLILKALKHKNLNNEIYEVGSGKGISLERLYKTINFHFKKSTKFILTEPHFDKIRHTKANIQNTKEKFHWKPRYDLKKGLSRMFSR